MLKQSILMVSLIVLFGYTLEAHAEYEQYISDIPGVPAPECVMAFDANGKLIPCPVATPDCAKKVFDGASVAGCDVKNTKPMPTPTTTLKVLKVNQKVATDGLGNVIDYKSETDTSGEITKRINRSDPEFKTLVNNTNSDILFKDEEKTGADMMMTPELQEKLRKLAVLVKAEYPGLKLRVTEAWDEGDGKKDSKKRYGEHSGNSLHYDGRAVDITVSDVDSKKLGRLGQLAVDAGFDWVWHEPIWDNDKKQYTDTSNHIHASVKKASQKTNITPQQGFSFGGIANYIRGLLNI